MTCGPMRAFDSGFALGPDAIVAASPRMTGRVALGAPRRTPPAVAGSAVALSMLRNDESRLLRSVDGQRTVAEIVRMSRLPANTALHALRSLCQRGILTVTTSGPPATRRPDPDVNAAPAQDRPQSEPATPLFRVGQYDVALRLGHGGVASTYLCRRVAAGGFQRLFTLKVVGRHADQELATAAFQREARIGGVLDHPNIQRLVDV